MKVFEISVKFEQNEEWSNRKADTKGYLVKREDEDDLVEGYVEVLYPSLTDTTRYIKGLYSKEGALVFVQMSNDSFLSPICYCFPDIKKEGYWSAYDTQLGFFPVCTDMACSEGHAIICINEITGVDIDTIQQNTSAIFEENSNNAIWVNKCLMQDLNSLTDFLDEGTISQMMLHCGKW